MDHSQVQAAGEVDQSLQSACSGRSTRGAEARGDAAAARGEAACEGNVYVGPGDAGNGGGGGQAAREKVGATAVVDGPGNGMKYSDSGKEAPRVPKGKFKPNLAKYGKNRGGGAVGRGGGSAKAFTDSDAAVLEGGDVTGSKEELVGGGPGAVKGRCCRRPSSSLHFSPAYSLVIQKSMSLKYEPSSSPRPSEKGTASKS